MYPGMGPQRPVQNSETKEVEFCLKGNSVAWSSSLKREVLWPGWGKEIILFPEMQLIPLDISEGYHYGCYFEEKPLISGRVHCHRASSIRRNRNPGMSQLCFGIQAHLAPILSKHLPFYTRISPFICKL